MATSDLNPSTAALASLNLKDAVNNKLTDIQHINLSDTIDRTRFVGNLEITCDAEEPLLKEDGHRFVLFPIKYHEVCLFCSPLILIL